MQSFTHANSDAGHSAGRARRSSMKELHPAFLLAGFMKSSCFVRACGLLLALLWFLQDRHSRSKRPELSPLTLQQAVKIALEKNPLRKAALADTRVASADVREARSVLMPRLTFSETATRGNDPVYVFGSKLRQQRFTIADFDLNQAEHSLALREFQHAFWREAGICLTRLPVGTG